jgi:putative flavoprotein involved in K+ transport
LHLMGYYNVPIDNHPNREQVRDRTNHYVTGRGGGRDIDLRKFALEGMHLYGPLRDIRGGVAQFGPGLKRYLDDADDVYRSINRTIDEFIAKKGLDAPTETPYVAPWAPEKELFEVDFNERIRAVVWCIGFSADFSWVKAPVFDESHYPVHERGVTATPGLYFIGLPWLYTWGSGRFSGVGRDATYIVERMNDLLAAGVPTKGTEAVAAAS